MTEQRAQRQIQILTFLLNCRLVSWTEEEACSPTNLPLAVFVLMAPMLATWRHPARSRRWAMEPEDSLAGLGTRRTHTHTCLSACLFLFAYGVCTFISPFVPTPTCGRDENVGAHTLIYTYYANRERTGTCSELNFS